MPITGGLGGDALANAAKSTTIEKETALLAVERAFRNLADRVAVQVNKLKAANDSIFGGTPTAVTDPKPPPLPDGKLGKLGELEIYFDSVVGALDTEVKRTQQL